MTPAYFQKPAPAPPAKRQYSTIREKTFGEKIELLTRKHSRSGPKGIPKKKIGRNKKRQAVEFARTFGSVARVKFVQSLPCFATGQYATEADPIDNAHVCDDGSKGASRRSGYACIAPLKRSAHRLLHRDAGKFIAKYGAFDWHAAAAWTESEWQKCAGGRVMQGETCGR